MVVLESRHYAENTYSGRDWNFEKTTKYIFRCGGRCVEAGCFAHYYKDIVENTDADCLKLKKHVVELPSSHGCPMKCVFCASSQIKDIRELTVMEMYEIFLFIYKENHLEKKGDVVVSMLGIGDPYFTKENVAAVIRKIAAEYPDIRFCVSSCRWTPEMVTKIESMTKRIHFRAVQMTFITSDSRKTGKVIPYFKDHPYDLGLTIAEMHGSGIENFKINYVVLPGINDSPEDVDVFIEQFRSVKKKTVVRISKVNMTAAGKKNGIIESGIGKMKEIQIRLNYAGFKTYLFYSAKNDNMNCGQLLTEKPEF